MSKNGWRESAAWKMPPVAKWKWTFERSQNSERISPRLNIFHYNRSLPPGLKSNSNTKEGGAVFFGLYFYSFFFHKKAFHPTWLFQYLGSTTLPVCKVPIDGWCEAAISRLILQPEITVPVRSNHSVGGEKSLIALHPTYKVWLKWVCRRSAVGCWYVIIVH